MFYEEILRVLQKHRVRYLILGGAAVNLHGVPRMTGDLDLAVDMSEDNIDALVGALEEAGLKPSLPIDPRGLTDDSLRQEWRDKKHLEALTFQSMDAGAPYREVDIILDCPLAFDVMFESRLELRADDLTINVVSLPHLIEIKGKIGREQDLSDVEALEKIEKEVGGGNQGSGLE